MNIKALYLAYHNVIVLLLAFMFSCNSGQGDKKFDLLSSKHTGINFQNNLLETPEMNIFSYLYFYNGGGVAAGDLNGDRLPDLYFTSNKENNALYINKGDFKFSEITESAGVAGKKGWTTGVTMADVNGDGKLDIYVSQLGDYKHIVGKNQLYINLGNNKNGNPTFEDQANEYGLDLKGFSTQAVFFDYDLDGDLDMYMLNHSVHSNGTYGKSNIRSVVHPLAGDKLLRNDEGKFVDVTSESGIYSSALGYGLGVSVGDVNWDGYPDIYVGNDFHENDYLYINNGNGTFSETLDQSIMHTSRYSMGNDIADINNDGLPDILSLDMLPYDPVMLKSAAGEDAYDIYNFKLSYGYNHQYVRNTLQLNRGNGTFSEIGAFAGIHATDWSWSGLITDLDLDGNKDIFVSNGIKRRLNDSDYINYISNDAIQSRLEGDISDEDLALVSKMPVVKIPNQVFKNKGQLQFEEVSRQWGLGDESFSNGAVYADLDNDGDLDLVVNNIDQEAFIYRNNTISEEKKENNFLKIRFEGEGLNTQGIGAKVIIPTKDGRIVHEMFNSRGFQSAVSNELSVGLGEQDIIDSLIVVWPDKSFQVLTQVKTNQHLEVKQANAEGQYVFNSRKKTIFSPASQSLVNFKHKENKYIDFDREPLIPHMTSTEGPKLAVGDINGDGLDDFFIGGAKRQAGAIFIQTPEGFTNMPQPALKADSVEEDIGAEFVDVNNDGSLDLVVVSGGSEFSKKDKETLVRLYLNDGNGSFFSRNSQLMPEIYVTGSVVKAGDFDGDGNVDLFIGGRVVPGNYGVPANSHLLRNKGKGHFEEVTDKIAPGLNNVGLVKDAAWADMDGDGSLDLVIAGEWMPVTILFNKGNNFQKSELDGLSKLNGLWNTIQIADINNDGLPDIIAGNLGLNSKLKATEEKPVSLHVGDFDENGKIEQLLMYFIGNKEHLFATKDEIAKQLPSIKNKYLKHTDFAKANIYDIIPKAHLAKGNMLYVNELRSGVFVNKEDNNFEFLPFPATAQFSPINSIAILDYNNDMRPDIISGGNMYEVNIQFGRYDADFGTLLKNIGNGRFLDVPNSQSGLNIKGQVRDIKLLNYRQTSLALFAVNNDSVKLVDLNRVKATFLTGK